MTTIYEQLTIGKRIPTHEEYKSSLTKMEFWEESVEVSDDYWDVRDPNNNKSLKSFPRECTSDYKWRKEISIPYNYMGSILNKYLSTAFKKEALRTDSEFYSNVDLLGSTMQEFMEMATKSSLINGVSYILPDNTSNDESLSDAQRRIIGSRSFLRFIEAEDVPNWKDYLGHLQEIIIELEDANDVIYYMYYDNENYARIDVDEKGNIVAISELTSHGFSQIPVTRILPFDTEESFVSSGALLQLSINNISSLIRLELYKCTFTRYFGAGIEDKTDPNTGEAIPIEWGSQSFVYCANPGASVTTIGADVNQADSLRTSMEDEVKTLFQQYHLSATQLQDATQTPSGFALTISRADFNSICNQIVKETEKAENTLILLLNEVESLNLDVASYSREFVTTNEEEDILKLRDILALDIPDEAKQIAKERFINKYLTNE